MVDYYIQKIFTLQKSIVALKTEQPLEDECRLIDTLDKTAKELKAKILSRALHMCEKDPLLQQEKESADANLAHKAS